MKGGERLDHTVGVGTEGVWRGGLGGGGGQGGRYRVAGIEGGRGEGGGGREAVEREAAGWKAAVTVVEARAAVTVVEARAAVTVAVRRRGRMIPVRGRRRRRVRPGAEPKLSTGVLRRDACGARCWVEP